MMYRKPAQIERASMEIIEGELRERGISLPSDMREVVKRVIHTTADFEFADTLKCSPGAVEAGIEALRRGVKLVTDTNMSLAGISRSALEKLGCEAVCFMADPQVARQAREQGVTRAVISMRKADSLWPDCIYAIGNAPTALGEIACRIREGSRPSLIIAVPVGFVNVVEAKEEIRELAAELGIPFIAAMGRKGGSTVAAAICNALLYQAAGMTDPETRIVGMK